MDLYQKLVEKDLLHLAKNIIHDNTGNLSADEKKSFNSLYIDSTIVIINADKGGAVVVLNATSYREEAL